MIIAGTGHRPNKLGGYDALAGLKVGLVALEYLKRERPHRVISGMALGWDQELATAALALGIPLWAAIPFDGQEKAWPEESQEKYHDILQAAHSVTVVCEGGYAPWKMQKRNEWMVDKATKMAALWDGSAGGTANCIRYAQKMGKPIDNLWDEFVKEGANV